MIKTKSIKQTLIIKASTHQIYEALIDSKKHSKFTGAAAKISKKVGGKFNAYDRYINGINLELTKDKKIVQSWRASDWPSNHYSTVIYLLKPMKSGTKLIFSQKKFH